MSCACCGEAKTTVALRSRDDVALCRDCLGWLAGQIGVSSTPTLPVVDIAEAVAFYERAGFGVRIYTDDNGEGGDGFAFVDYRGESVFDLDAATDMDPRTNRAGCYLITNDADDWHARLTAAGLPVTPIADQPWGMREFTLTDPSGNHVRIGRARGGHGEVTSATDGPPTWASWREAVGVVCYRPHVRKTGAIALVVGTVLFCINQLDVVLRGDATAVVWFKSAVTYVVPFVISNLGGLVASRLDRPTRHCEPRAPGR